MCLSGPGAQSLLALPGGFIVSMSLRPAIPRQVGLHQSPPPLHRLKVILIPSAETVNHHPARAGEFSTGEMRNFQPALTELQGMTRLLIDDVTLLKPITGELNPDVTPEQQANRRFYVRAVFALVEAFVEQHRRLLLDLCEIRRITLPEKKYQKLREIRAVSLEDGTVEEQPQYLQIFDKIKRSL
jgi:hypothetical protein